MELYKNNANIYFNLNNTCCCEQARILKKIILNSVQLNGKNFVFIINLTKWETFYSMNRFYVLTHPDTAKRMVCSWQSPPAPEEFLS